MTNCMNFPDDWREFLKNNSFQDTHEVYTNGAELISVLRVEQLIEHLLEEQEPRVLTLEEVLSSPDTMIWVDEIWNDENSAEQYALIENFTYENCYVILRFFNGSSSEESTHYYNEKWRCWSAKPTDEQRKAVKWDD